MGTTDLIEKFALSSELMCYIRKEPAGVRAHLLPVNPYLYWQTHRDIDLTEREVEKILEAVKRAKEAT